MLDEGSTAAIDCRKPDGKCPFAPPYAFEKEAYGQEVLRTWQACASVQKYIVKDAK